MAVYELGTFDGITAAPFDYEELACASSTPLTATKLNPGGTFPDKVRGVAIVVTGQAVHFRIDGGTPTSTVGIPAAVGDVIKLWGEEALKKFRGIQDAASALLRVTYFR